MAGLLQADGHFVIVARGSVHNCCCPPALVRQQDPNGLILQPAPISKPNSLIPQATRQISPLSTGSFPSRRGDPAMCGAETRLIGCGRMLYGWPIGVSHIASRPGGDFSRPTTQPDNYIRWPYTAGDFYLVAISDSYENVWLCR